MKNFRYISTLIIIWIVTILAFAISFSIYGATYMGASSSVESYTVVEYVFLFAFIFCFSLFFGLLASFPGFLFFGVISYLILKTQLEQKTKKILILLVNYLNIGVTCVITYFIIYGINERQQSSWPVNNYFIWHPNWVIILVSTLCILLIPFEKKTVKSINQSL